MSYMTIRKRAEAKIVIAIDIGTTYSAASYCIFTEDGHRFQEVNRWPKQTTADAKIPSVLYYDGDGACRLYGAETEDDELIYLAEKEGWQRAEWWKLLLRPDYLPLPDNLSIPPLPNGIIVDDAFRDFLAYIKSNIQAFIVRAHSKGEQYWKELSSSMYVVLTTPNGWEGKHQHRMRLAAIQAQLVGPDEGDRIKFVSEGEAAVHYCLDQCADLSEQVSVGSVVIICDAGGGTTDIGVYKINHLGPIVLEEVSGPTCFIAGGVIVDMQANEYIATQLKGSQWGTPDCLAAAYKTFSQRLKRQFQGSEEFVCLPLIGPRGNEQSRGISRGRLMIPRETMASFFSWSLQQVTQGLKKTLNKESWSVETIFLVGGFAESPYVYSEIKSWSSRFPGLRISKPDQVLSKAIAHGALSWYKHSAVQVKAAKMHYGAETDVEFDAKSPEMAGRCAFQDALGQWRVRHGWKSIIQKNVRFRPKEEYRTWFHRRFMENESLDIEMELYAYRWVTPPAFFKNPDGSLIEGFIHLGTVTADLTQCFNAAAFKTSKKGIKYKTLQYEICFCFGETEIRAWLRWKEQKFVKIGNATVVYDI